MGKMPLRIIYLMGLDGSGKTTLATTMVDKANLSGIKVSYFYGQYIPRLIVPAKRIAEYVNTKLSKASDTGYDGNTNYEEHRQKPRFNNQNRIISYLYYFLILTDYILFTYIRILPTILKGGIVIVDRYYIDVCVNLAIILGLDRSKRNLLMRVLGKLFPRPTNGIYLRIQPELALKRKSDIPSLSYLAERYEIYEEISKSMNFQILDAEKKQDDVADQGLQILKRLCERGTQEHNILLVHANNDDVGGADYCLMKMAVELKRIGYEVIVLLRKRSEILTYYNYHNIQTIVKPILRLQKPRRVLSLVSMPFQALYTVFFISHLIRKYNITVVHSNDLLEFLPSISAKIMRRKAVQHVRMIVQNRFLKFVLKNICLALNDVILCVSQGTKRAMFGENPKARILYDWIDLKTAGHLSQKSNIRQELNLTEGHLLIGCVGRIEPWKGQHIFVTVAERLCRSNNNIHFVLVGGAVPGKEEYFHSILNQIYNSEFGDRIHYLGERRDIAAIMEQLDILVHTSVRPDPFPGVVLEALSCGTPVVAANAGGVPEQIEDGETGFLYEPGDLNSLIDRLLQLLNDSETRQRMSVNARKSITKKFGKRVLSKRLEEIYEAI